jgi:hypothetical protein
MFQGCYPCGAAFGTIELSIAYNSTIIPRSEERGSDHMAPKGMDQQDWEDCRVSVSQHLEMYHRAASKWLLWLGLPLIGYGWFSSGWQRWCLWLGIGVEAYYWFKLAKLIIAREALFAGYEMGFEAAQVRAMGITMAQYLETIRRGEV